LRRSVESAEKALELATRLQIGTKLNQPLRTLALRRVLAVVLGVAGCSLAFVCSSSADWSAPQKLASSRVWSYARPVLASDTAGDAIVGWHRENELNETLSGIEASIRPRRALWSPPVVLTATRQGGAYAPQVSIGPDGNAAAVWHGLARLEAATRPAAGTWSRPSAISRRTEELDGAATAALAVDARGGVKAVFDSRQGRLFTIELASRGPHGGWQAPRKLAASRYPLQEPQIETDARGETLIAWVRGGPRPRVQSLVLGANGKANRPAQTVASGKGRLRELHLAVNAGGEAILLWRLQVGRRSSSEVARRSAGARFTRAVVVAREDDSELTGTIDARGEAIVLFTHTSPGQVKAVEAATARPRARWSTPVPLAPGRETAEPQIGADPSGGAAVAAWTAGRFGSHTGAIEASARNPQGGWQTPIVVSGLGGFSPSIVVNANGKATAAWIGEAPAASGVEAIETADFE
jgi:hypothetical protein